MYIVGQTPILASGPLRDRSAAREKRDEAEMRRTHANATAASLTALLTASGVRADWIDCQRQRVSPEACADPAEWARRLFHDPPPWVVAALSLRDRVAAILGLRAASPETFGILAQNEQEVVIGSNDRHLDFRASVRCADGAVSVITIVQIHNLLGRLYVVPVRLVHAVMVRRMLLRAAARLDPRPDLGTRVPER